LEERHLIALALEESFRKDLPSEHPDHTCNMFCDGQDGQTSYCYRLRKKLFG